MRSRCGPLASIHSPANLQGHQDRPTALPRFLVSLVAPLSLGCLFFQISVAKGVLSNVRSVFPILQYLFLRPMKKVFFLMRQDIYIDTVGKCVFLF